MLSKRYLKKVDFNSYNICVADLDLSFSKFSRFCRFCS